MNGCIAKIQELTVGYGRKTVLREVDLELLDGQFWFLVGPNGQGKTTFIRSLLGQIRPRSGAVHYCPGLNLREDIGFVTQRGGFHPSLPTTVNEFVELGLVGLRVSRAERREQLAWALERLELAELGRQDYWTLSGGQRQRALVARTLIRRPRLMLLDEPTVGLDLRAENTLLQALQRLNRTEAMTLLFVTHELNVAMGYATHVALFHQGRVMAGPRADMLTRENLETVYGVSFDPAFGGALNGWLPAPGGTVS